MSKAVEIWRKINGPLDADDNDHAGIFLVGLAIADELTPKAVAEVSGLKLATVRKLWAKAEQCGIIVNGGIHANWDDEQDGALSLVLDERPQMLARAINGPIHARLDRHPVIADVGCESDT